MLKTINSTLIDDELSEEEYDEILDVLLETQQTVEDDKLYEESVNAMCAIAMR